MPETMAMSVVAMLPTLVVFFIAQRYFIQGIVISGVRASSRFLWQQTGIW